MADRFGYKSKVPVSCLISQYEFLESLKQQLPANVFTRVNMLPERVVHLLNHYEAVEQLKGAISPNMVTRVTMLPEGVVREGLRDNQGIEAMFIENKERENLTDYEVGKSGGRKPSSPGNNIAGLANFQFI